MARLFYTLCTTVVLAALTVADQDKLYFSSPALGTSWKSGEHVFFEWRNAPMGSAEISIDDIGVTDKTKSRFTSKKDGYCDRGVKNEPCARFNWVVPQNIEPGMYPAMISVNDAEDVAVSVGFDINVD